MEKETFCDKHCPIPTRYSSINEAEDVYAECDLEENQCPFKNVNFTLVEARNDGIV